MSIASLIWRKRRIQKKRELDLAAELDHSTNAVRWEHPPGLAENRLEIMKQEAVRLSERNERSRCVRDDYEQLLSFSTSLYRDQSPVVLRLTVKMLPAEFAEHLQKACPENDFETTQQWIAALKKEVDSQLLPMVRKRHPTAPNNRYAEIAAKC